MRSSFLRLPSVLRQYVEIRALCSSSASILPSLGVILQVSERTAPHDAEHHELRLVAQCIMEAEHVCRSLMYLLHGARIAQVSVTPGCVGP